MPLIPVPSTVVTSESYTLTKAAHENVSFYPISILFPVMINNGGASSNLIPIRIGVYTRESINDPSPSDPISIELLYDTEPSDNNGLDIITNAVSSHTTQVKDITSIIYNYNITTTVYESPLAFTSSTATLIDSTILKGTDGYEVILPERHQPYSGTFSPYDMMVILKVSTGALATNGLDIVLKVFASNNL